MNRDYPYNEDFVEIVNNLDKVTAKNNVVSDGGNIILTAGKIYKPIKVNWSVGWWGRTTGLYYPPKPQSIVLDGIWGSWEVAIFKEFDELLTEYN